MSRIFTSCDSVVATCGNVVCFLSFNLISDTTSGQRVQRMAIILTAIDRLR